MRRGLPEALRHKDVVHAGSGCVGEYTNDDVAELVVERDRVTRRRRDLLQRIEYIRVQVLAVEVGSAEVIIGPEPDGRDP